jgi:sec-independent protein translocase protein TatC
LLYEASTLISKMAYRNAQKAAKEMPMDEQTIPSE